MTREELIKQCRFYKGEKECPYNDTGMRIFWSDERRYVNWGGEPDGNYEYYGGKEYKDIPIGVLRYLFSYWEAHDERSYESHKDLIEHFYKEVADEYVRLSTPDEILRDLNFMEYLKNKHEH